MKRRLLSFLLPLALLLSLNARAESALLPRELTYEGQFADVQTTDWYYPYVAASYEYGLINGRGDGFAPDEPITVAELLTLSARLHAAWAGETIADAQGGEVWYAPYAAYLTASGLLPEGLADSANVPATRAELAAILARALPAECYDGRNDELVASAHRSGGYITDVNDDTPYAGEILWLYRQGLLAGMDAAGSYQPDKTTTRAETAALLTRMVDPALRVTLEWTVSAYRSAAGSTLAGLICAPQSAPKDPAPDDTAAIDAAVRQMLSSGENTLELEYPRGIMKSGAAALARALSACVKGYCEQMYNTVECVYSLSGGRVTATFSASGCKDEELARYRTVTMEKAIEVHDTLWESGQLTADMSQYEIARVYYRWLCDNCAYDSVNARNDYSLSHIAYSALIDGKAVCDGYTGAYNLFLKLEGIECHAMPSDKTNHIWTVATLDGTQYHIDVTWGDETGGIDWSYFGMTAEEAYRAHPW